MTHALITGGLGFIGSFVARQLLSEGLVDKVVVLDHFGRYVSSLRQEFTDYRKLRLEGISDDAIISFAAYKSDCLNPRDVANSVVLRLTYLG